ncbi:protein mono-ADP-ribosyltransferase PARP4 isoform X2 [Etheostoma spectabile]|uniref:protein mono-ADP-ribosyltransferase PARP4 isoform X2 n=1 Tax=Etheostoma spectabile TaxID=54343 RepID=UPI0013AF634D|nr:protein mono-ADP-ribosyltransferase PARP4 isoform X2 [Etheostoma spectabile]
MLKESTAVACPECLFYPKQELLVHLYFLTATAAVSPGKLLSSMAVFENCSMLFELKTLPFKEKTKLKSAVTENGGHISFVVNKQCSLIVTSSVSNLSSNRLRNIQKYNTPVVGVDYVYSCLERGLLLPVEEYKLDISSAFSPALPFSSMMQSPLSKHGPAKPVDSVHLNQKGGSPERSGNILEMFRIYTETDFNLPTYPEHFQVAKYSIFEKINSKTWCVLELQSYRGEKGQQYRVVRYCKDDIGNKAAVRDMLVFLSTSEEALEVYKALREKLQATGLQLRNSTPAQAGDLGSAPLQQLLLEEKLNTGSLSQEVGVFVELLWTEALGCLSNILRVPIDKLSLNDVSRAEGLLLQAQRKLREGNNNEVVSLLTEVYTLLPHIQPLVYHVSPTAKFISQKLDLCQLIKDVLNVSEMTLRCPTPSCLGKYRALRCSIETVPPGTAEFQAVTALLQDRKVQVHQVVCVSRGVELQTFKSDIGNIKPLLHSSSPSNFVGLLSRGLLLPRVGVEHHGIERTDVGNLGSGIYFSDSMSTSLKYSKPSETDGSRLLLVCDVALGRCERLHKRDLTLTQAPEGHHSVHGVRCTPNTPSEFEDDEYVVYSPDQVKLKYVVQFSVEGEQLKEFSPAINTSDELGLPSEDQQETAPECVLDDGFETIKNPLADVTAGLLDSSGQQLPLQAVHVKCKLMDLLSQVIIFQKYTNLSPVPIEAKYVFPLDDSAAVCGFEAFINGKHVVGQVKEKEQARKEYKQAIERGHGAYLMDQDAPDVFTISVGNLPPGATVLIKVTFVSELIVRDGSILFSLPGSVAPWQESASLNQTTQVTVEKVCVTDEAREFTLDVSVEMPHEITNLQCITHQVKIKRTDCKAVVSVLPGEVMGQEGFQLSVTLSEVHLPRMWVEKHPDKDSQASMLVFYPDFENKSSSSSDEVILLLDTSESMKEESLRMAQKLALQVLKTLDNNLRLNVIFFGTDHTEAFLAAQPYVKARPAAESFIKRSSPVGGSTELWRPLRALSLLPPSRGVRNLLLLSDGHIQNAELTLQLLRDNAQHSRLFTCGLSPTANRHMLRALARAGGGAYEFFDTKTKHNWAEKVACQVKRMSSPGCSSVSVKWQQFNPTAAPPVQAPKQLNALFNDCHTLVYGFVPHCTQATLHGNLSGQKLKTMVSTSELQKTKGTFLHKLTARALIRDYEDGSLDANEAEHEGKKADLKRFIIELSKEFSILSQFTSFVAIEERDSEQTEQGFTDIPKLIKDEDVDFLPYISWISPQDSIADDTSLVLGEYYGMNRWLSNDDVLPDLMVAAYCVESHDYESACSVTVNMCADSTDEMMVESSDDYEPPCIVTEDMCDDRTDEMMLDEGLCLTEKINIPYNAPTSEALRRVTYTGVHRPILRGHTLLSTVPCPPPPPPRRLLGASRIQTAALASPVPSPLSSLFGHSARSFDRLPGLPGLPLPPTCMPPLGSGSLAVQAPQRMQHFSQLRLERSNQSMSPEIPMFLDSIEPAALCKSMSMVRPATLSKTCNTQQHLQSVNQDPAAQQPQSFGITEFLPQVQLSACSVPQIKSRPKSFRALSRTSFVPSGSLSQDQSSEQDYIKIRSSQHLRRKKRLLTLSDQEALEDKSRDPEVLHLRWTKIFQLQHREGYWELTTELGELINVDADLFANVFLKNKGIQSLGVKAHEDILKLVATLLVLQLMRVEKLKEGNLLRTLFCLDDSPQPRPERWEQVKRAVDWVCWADRQYPCVYSRLEFGLSWETSTRQLLGCEGLPPFSPLSGLNLQRAVGNLMVH